MLAILIVDDDPLSRKGIRTLMPWSDLQMEVVGEASNGKEALDFLRENDIDLVLVDLDMPIMNGIEFIQHASLLYPHLNYVVLTVHTEFEYVQKALRLGAIDYIAKNQVDPKNSYQIMSRIRSSISKKSSQQQKLSSLNWKESTIFTPDIYSLISLNTENEEHIFEFWTINHLSDRKDIYEIMPGVWIFTDERKEFCFPEYFFNTMLLKISDVRDMTYSQLGNLLRTYVKNQFFYDYQPLKKINHKRAYELTENEYITDKKTLETLTANWISLNWIHDTEIFQQLKFDLKNSKLKPSSLYHMLLVLENVWNTAYSGLIGETLTPPDYFYCWKDVEAWLSQIYEKTNLFYATSPYSQEVTQNILAAKTYIENHYDSPLEATEIARHSHMSYGYFSRCFHDIIGSAFSDYCIQVRIRQAQKLLTGTQNTIQQIAADVGYNDEKYFSRIFKKSTGQTPSEYRQNKGGCRDVGGKT